MDLKGFIYKAIDFLEDHEILFGLIVIALILIFIMSVAFIHTSVERNRADGGIIIDKIYAPSKSGHLMFYFVVNKNNNISSLQVDEDEYYSYDVGNIFSK